MNPARRVALTATCALALALPFSAAAQTAQAPGTPEEASPQDIVVTANKRAERLKDVPASITAISAEALVGRGANGFEDYAAKSPGLNINNASAGGGLNQISIRGVTTGGGGNPTVGFYIDDAPFGSSTNLGGGAIFAPDLDPSDLARIEVLRGPQGTLYGAGSMGGLIKFVTQSPNFDQFSGRIQVDGNQVDGGGTGYGVRAAANIPLSGNLGLRVSGFDRWDPGFVDDAARDARNVNGARFVGGRASLAWRINDDWSIRASALIQHQSGHGTSTEDFDLATGKLLYGDLRQVRAPGTGALRATYNLYDVRIEGHLGWAELVSATSYGKLSSRINTDATPLYGPMLSDALGLPGLGAAIQGQSNLEKVTQELRLSSPANQAFAWQVGLFYTHEQSMVTQELPLFMAATGGPLPVSLPSALKVSVPSTFSEIAVFGDATYRFSSRFDITAGLRYSRNRQSADEGTNGFLVGPPSTVHLASRDGSLTYMITPRLHLSDNMMVYARVASGYRPGGPNIVVTNVPASYKPDTLTNYEVGLKTDLFHRLLSVEASAFYIDWKDVQLLQISPLGTSYYSNAGKAASKGAEISVSLRPARGFVIDGNLSFIDATLGRALPLPTVGAKGDALPFTPRWSGQISAEYEFALGGDWTGTTGGDFRYIGDRQSGFAEEVGEPRFQLPAYNVVDLHAGVRKDGLSLNFYVKNIGNNIGQENGFILGPIVQVSVIRPRTFGFSIAKTF